MNRFVWVGALLTWAPWTVAARRAAELLGQQGAVGVVAPGAYADLIAVAGDPLGDVNVLKSVQFVMKDGAVFKSSPNAAPAP